MFHQLRSLLRLVDFRADIKRCLVVYQGHIVGIENGLKVDSCVKDFGLVKFTRSMGHLSKLVINGVVVKEFARADPLAFLQVIGAIFIVGLYQLQVEGHGGGLDVFNFELVEVLLEFFDFALKGSLLQFFVLALFQDLLDF